MRTARNQGPNIVDANVNERREAQAKSAILNFLTELKITKIVYVDDRCSINELKEAYIGKLKAHYKAKPTELDIVQWESAAPVFEKQINDLWDSKNDEERRELFLKILTFENNLEELENSVAPLKLKSLLADKIDLLSPAEWIAKKDVITATLAEEAKILFLFDIEFGHAPLQDQRDGRDLAFELLQDSAINDLLYCGLFSHLFSTAEEYDKRSEYCRTHALQKERFYTISKKRFQNSSYLPALAEGIRNTLLINEVEQLKRDSLKILRTAFNKSANEINGLTPESFNHIIQRSSKTEGVWEINTLIRIANISTSYNALTSLLNNQQRKKINHSLNKIRQVEKIKTGGETPVDKSQVIELRSKELYVGDEILNQLHYPLANGDIFRIQDKDYVLLVQPCNVAMRSNGSRDRKYNLGFLVEIETISLEVLNGYKKGQLATLEIIEEVALQTESIKIARFSTFKSVSLSPLDLAVFSKDGISRINLSETENHSLIIQESWKTRYKHLHKEFVDFANQIKTFRKLRITNKNILKSIVFNTSIFTGYEINNEDSLSKSGKLLQFNIRRLCHYKSPYSDDLLQKFMAYLSRNAFDHDFSS